MSTQISVIPQGTQLPAHLQGGDVAADIARYNAAAAGGIKLGSFPRISIKGGKFHEKEGGETRTLLGPAVAGQPPVPMMCLEAVIVAANPNLIKTYYPGKYVEGDDREPACSSSNGVTPDAHIVEKQHSVCATCPQNQWGSKVSEMSGKDIKACDDSKQLVILPAGDLSYKALGLTVTKSALTDWGKYVKALTERGYPVNATVTNITFDHTAAYPKLQFAFNRFLSPEDYAKVKERAKGDDVSLIAKPAERPIALPAPGAVAQPAHAAAQAALNTAAKAALDAAPIPPVPPVQPVVATGFGATAATQAPQQTTAPAPVVPTEPAKRTRRTRAQIEADNAATVIVQPQADGPFAGQPPHVALAVTAAGGLDSAPGQATYKALTGKDVPVAQPKAVPPETAAPRESTHGPAEALPVATGVPAGTAPTGFGGTVAPAAASAAVTSSAASLKDILMKKLGIQVPAAT